MKKFVVREYRISLDEKRFQGCGLVTAVLLSDLHGVWHGEGQKALVKAVKDQNPDLILSAGDLITAGGPCDGVYALMEKLAGTYPVFAGNGNHETKLREEEPESYEVYEGELKRLGVQMLRNEKANLTIHSLPIEVAGLEIGREHYRRIGAKKVTASEMDGLLPRPSKEKYSILIAHNPVHFGTYRSWGADLTVSGHLHGGYVRLPGIGGIVSPQMRPFPKYDRGLYEESGQYLAVSAGLGDHHMPVRIGNPRELVVLHIGAGKKTE